MWESFCFIEASILYIVNVNLNEIFAEEYFLSKNFNPKEIQFLSLLVLWLYVLRLNLNELFCIYTPTNRSQIVQVIAAKRQIGFPLGRVKFLTQNVLQRQLQQSTKFTIWTNAMPIGAYCCLC